MTLHPLLDESWGHASENGKAHEVLYARDEDENSTVDSPVTRGSMLTMETRDKEGQLLWSHTLRRRSGDPQDHKVRCILLHCVASAFVGASLCGATPPPIFDRVEDEQRNHSRHISITSKTDDSSASDTSRRRRHVDRVKGTAEFELSDVPQGVFRRRYKVDIGGFAPLPHPASGNLLPSFIKSLPVEVPDARRLACFYRAPAIDGGVHIHWWSRSSTDRRTI